MKNLLRTAALLAVVGLGAACDLKVQNPNQPETLRVLASPADVESLLSSYWKRWHSGMWGNTTSNVEGMAKVQSFEDYSSLSNNCLGQRVGIPRAANDNSIGNSCAAEQLRVYQLMAETDRVASSIIARLNAGLNLGSPAQNARAVAFGQFLRGLSLGYLSLVYDSAAITVPETPADSAGDLRAYADVNAAALAALQLAIDNANTSGTSSTGFPLPAGWIPSSTNMTQAEFIKLCHSYMARFRANVARTPAERAAVNWAAVVTDATAGISADHDNITNTVTGPYNQWLNQFYAYGTWHQMTPFIIGMGDVSGAYQVWLSQAMTTNARGSLGSFTMVTPDLRWPQGANRAAQNADFAITSCNGASQVCKRYFVNRPPASDVTSGSAWGLSNYDHARFWSWRTSGDATALNGKLIFMSKTEMDMLAAEGLIRQGGATNFQTAAGLINRTRTTNGLPAITTFDNTTPVPGGANCVPQVPLKANYQADGSFTAPYTACGNMMEAMKWEKRMETAYTGFAQWFFDSRGWGDLPKDTGTQWPVPYQDLQARLHNVYSTGGGINPYSAAQSGYGW